MNKFILGSVFAAAVLGASAAYAGPIAETVLSVASDKALLASGALVVAALIAAALDRIHVDRSQ